MSILGASLVGLFLAVVLSPLPFAGPVLGGVAAGRIAGGGIMKRALAGLLSGTLAGILLWFVLTHTGVTLSGPMGSFLGAIIGAGLIGVFLYAGFLAALGAVLADQGDDPAPQAGDSWWHVKHRHRR
ncbi:MAG TPA: DUF5518 domain-containing protein [bacterium]|nr:DUF5518 domain-containing protein [bacterium]